MNSFKVITLEAPDYHAAVTKAQQIALETFGTKGSVKSARQVAEGKKGFLGIGRVFPRFEAVIESVDEPAGKPAPGIQEHVQSLVRTLTAPSQGRSFGDPIDQAKKELQRIGPPAVEALIAALSQPLDEYQLSYVIEPLGKIGDPRAVEVLLRLANDSNNTIRRAAVEALRGIKDPRVVDPLIQALQDHDKMVKAYAAEGLGTIGDRRAVDALIAALADADEYVRRCAAEALGLLQDQRAVDALIAVAVNDDAERARKTALDALKRIDPDALERVKRDSATLAVTVTPDGTALYERLHSGKNYGEEKPLALAGTDARVYLRSGHIGERDRWILGIPTGLSGQPERRISIDIEQDPDRTVCSLLQRSRERQVALKAEGKVYKLIQSGEEISPDDPIVVGDLAYIFAAAWDKAWHLRVAVSREAEQDFEIPGSALATSEGLDKWVLDTIAGVGLRLMSTR